MPKEISAGEAAIRGIVKDELKDFYKKLIEPNFVTKDDLNNLTNIFATKEEMSSKHNEVMNTLDSMHGLMKEMRQEMSVMNHRVYKIQDPKIENHEKRITKLEIQIA